MQIKRYLIIVNGLLNSKRVFEEKYHNETFSQLRFWRIFEPGIQVLVIFIDSMWSSLPAHDKNMSDIEQHRQVFEAFLRLTRRWCPARSHQEGVLFNGMSLDQGSNKEKHKQNADLLIDYWGRLKILL